MGKRLREMTSCPMISFSRGVPAADLVDVEGLKVCAGRAFDRDPDGTTAYGTAAGYEPLREWVAGHHGVARSRVMVTNGSLQADALVFDELAVGAEVVVEDPTYDRTLLGLRRRGARIHAIPVEVDGLSTNHLAALLVDGTRPSMAHVIPSFQNPTGCTLSAAKRHRLLSLAIDHEFFVFEDDPYSLLRFSGVDQPTMLSLDDSGVAVVYASSFSKTVCPGIRVGYLIGPTGLIDRLLMAATNPYLSPSMMSQSILYEFCASGRLHSSIERFRQGLEERLRRMVSTLEKHLPGIGLTPPEGGHFLWATFPPDIDVAALAAVAPRHGVEICASDGFMVERKDNSVRLAYSGVSPDEIEEGIVRLVAAAETLRPGPARPPSSLALSAPASRMAGSVG
jgi:2-aminoadipate transaminase